MLASNILGVTLANICTDVKTPILCAAMAVPGINEMATAVTMAGGFGFMGTGESPLFSIISSP